MAPPANPESTAHLGESAGIVAELWRFPVKSMHGERLVRADVGFRGLIGDRAYAIVDRSTGEIASAKHSRTWPGLFACSATYVEEPCDELSAPPIKIRLPDGATLWSDDRSCDRILSKVFARDASLQRAEASTAPYFDVAPVHLLTTATLSRLQELVPDGRVDQRRFRPNILIATHPDHVGYVENDWVGHTLSLGKDLSLDVTEPCIRCVMVTMSQSDLPKDPRVLRALAQDNAASAGVYAEVNASGRIEVGDRVGIRATGIRSDSGAGGLR